jgi:cell division inhibitor SepF
MAVRDTFHRALVYFGLAEDDGYDDEPRDRGRGREPEPEPEAELEDRYRERPNVRRLQTRRRPRDDFEYREHGDADGNEGPVGIELGHVLLIAEAA